MRGYGACCNNLHFGQERRMCLVSESRRNDENFSGFVAIKEVLFDA